MNDRQFKEALDRHITGNWGEDQFSEQEEKEEGTFMNINEIFFSIQGEGPKTGVPSIFIRFQGCNLACHFCDSKYTWPDNSFDHTTSIEGILRKVSDVIPIGYEMPRNVVITGGEPLLQQKDLVELISKLIINTFSKFKTIEIETNGTILPTTKMNYQLGLSDSLFLNISPKFGQINMGSLKKLTSYNNSILKFVIEKKEDIKTVTDIVKELEFSRDKVYLMPEGVEDLKIKEKALWLVEECKKCGFNLTNRTHIWLWGQKRGV